LTCGIAAAAWSFGALSGGNHATGRAIDGSTCAGGAATIALTIGATYRIAIDRAPTVASQ
jgi:hypothetical protein